MQTAAKYQCIERRTLSEVTVTLSEPETRALYHIVNVFLDVTKNASDDYVVAIGRDLYDRLRTINRQAREEGR